MGITERRIRSGWERCQGEQWLDKTRGFLQVLGHLKISPGGKQELRQRPQPPAHPEPQLTTAQWLTRQRQGLQSHLLTDGCSTRRDFICFLLSCTFLFNFVHAVEGFFAIQPLGSTDSVVWLLHTTQHRNCFTLPA